MLGIALVLLAAAPGAEPGLAWKQTDHSLALVQEGKIVWQCNYPKKDKPYFHPITLGGGPSLTDFRPADHPWHRALWFSWKYINGLLYWEEDPKTGKSPGQTEVVKVTAKPGKDYSAIVEMNLSYHPPEKPAVLTEFRGLVISAPAKDGSYHIDWISTFTAGNTDVVLNRTPIAGEPQGVDWGGYAGLSLRLVPALKSWRFSSRDGPVRDRACKASWIAFSGPLEGGKSAAIIVLDHPKSFRHPTPWYLINDMPYFSPAVIYYKPYTLPARQSLTLHYRILIQPGAVECDAVEKKFQRFAKEPG